MRLDNPVLIDLLAQRYVLGVQRGHARQRFAKLADSRFEIGRAIADWETRLAPLAWSLEPVEPSPLVWRRIMRALDRGDTPTPETERRGGAAWRALAASMTFVALIAGAGWWQSSNKPPDVVTQTVVETVSVALVTDPAGQPLWLARIAADRSELLVRAINDIQQQPNNDYELWAIDSAGTTVSLALLPQTGQRTETLSDAALGALADSELLAVSLEPVGGSPGPAPTGPVLYTAALVGP